MRVTTHPGEVLEHEYLEPLGMSASALAELIDVPGNRMTDIISGRADLGADTARRLARYFGTTPRFWLNLQIQHDLSRAQGRLT